jgi:hypothetical protein
MFIGETWFGEIPGNPMIQYEILQLSVMGIGLIGLGLAWKWELIGVIIALVTFVALAIINPLIQDGFPWTYLVPITAILFIVLWTVSRDKTKPKP